MGSQSEPEARASPGPCLRLVLSGNFVDSSRTGGGPPPYWAGQRTTGGPVGAAPAKAAIPDRLESDLELIRRSRQFGALGDDEAAAVVAEPPPCLALDTPGWPRWIKVDAEERKISLSLLPPFKGNPVEAKAEEEDEDDADETPPAPRPEPKIPLKGGLGDRERRKN